MTTRLQAAEKIATALENDYSCTVWSKGSVVRVYLEQVTRKSKGRVDRRDNGYVSVEIDGSISVDNVTRQSGTIDGVIAELNLVIDAEQPVVALCPVIETPDDPMERLEHARQMELGRTGELLGA